MFCALFRNVKGMWLWLGAVETYHASTGTIFIFFMDGVCIGKMKAAGNGKLCKLQVWNVRDGGIT